MQLHVTAIASDGSFNGATTFDLLLLEKPEMPPVARAVVAVAHALAKSAPANASLTVSIVDSRGTVVDYWIQTKAGRFAASTLDADDLLTFLGRYY